jgi:hypothetical protein
MATDQAGALLGGHLTLTLCVPRLPADQAGALLSGHLLDLRRRPFFRDVGPTSGACFVAADQAGALPRYTHACTEVDHISSIDC